MSRRRNNSRMTPTEQSEFDRNFHRENGETYCRVCGQSQSPCQYSVTCCAVCGMSCGLSNGCGSDDCPEQESDKVPSWLVDSEEYLVQFGVGSTSLMQGEDIRHEIVAGRIVCDMPDNEVPFASAEWAGV